MARIFIADDDPDIRKVLTYALADAGHEVSVARDGQAALESILLDPPELLVLDLMMPEMGGYDVLEALDMAAIRDRMKVLIITAKGSERDREEGLAHGADFYMTKPFDPGDVAKVVGELLSASEEELKLMREREYDRAHLLSQLEDALGDA